MILLFFFFKVRNKIITIPKAYHAKRKNQEHYFIDTTKSERILKTLFSNPEFYMSLTIPILLGTAREGGNSAKVAQTVFKEMQKYEFFETELLKVSDFVTVLKTQGMEEKNANKWKEIMTKADGLIVVSPEYNHGYPGELKIMLDQLYDEYYRKPIGICGVSASSMGGVRMVEALRLVALELGMVPIHKAVYFSEVNTLFDHSQELQDSLYIQRMKNFFDELAWFAKALKEAREKLK